MRSWASAENLCCTEQLCKILWSPRLVSIKVQNVMFVGSLILPLYSNVLCLVVVVVKVVCWKCGFYWISSTWSNLDGQDPAPEGIQLAPEKVVGHGSENLKVGTNQGVGWPQYLVGPRFHHALQPTGATLNIHFEGVARGISHPARVNFVQCLSRFWAWADLVRRWKVWFLHVALEF